MEGFESFHCTPAIIHCASIKYLAQVSPMSIRILYFKPLNLLLDFKANSSCLAYILKFAEHMMDVNLSNPLIQTQSVSVLIYTQRQDNLWEPVYHRKQHIHWYTCCSVLIKVIFFSYSCYLMFDPFLVHWTSTKLFFVTVNFPIWYRKQTVLQRTYLIHLVHPPPR